MGDEKDAEHGNVTVSGHLVLPSLSLTATVKSRMNFAGPHLIAAALLSQHTGKVENANKGQRFGPFFDELLAYASSCILLSAAALESYANELFADASSNFPNLKPDDLEKTWAEIERKPILDKFSSALSLREANCFDKGALLYQDAKKLIKLRNALTHFKPEWFGEQLEHKKLSEELKGRIEGSPFLCETEGLFPRRFASHSCTKWAVQTCLAFAEEFEAKSGLESKFSMHRAKLVP